MSKKLIICEKPSSATAIAGALGGFKTVKAVDPKGQERPIYFTNEKDIKISWGYGHLVHYDASCPNNIEELPFIPTENDWFIKPISDSHEFQLENIRSLTKEDGLDTIINACDAEREGELIFNLIIDACGVNRDAVNLKRMWIQSMNKSALIEAYKNCKPSSHYHGLEQAARSRAKADWLVGINGSAAFSAISERIWQNTQSATIGRVKMAIIAIVCKRVSDVKNFVPVKYWEIKGTFSTENGEFEGKWIDISKYQIPNPDEDKAKNKDKDDSSNDDQKNGVEACSKIHSKEDLDLILARIANGDKLKPVTSFKDVVVRKETNVGTLYNLLQIQVEAGRRFKYTTSKVLEVVQKLYEKKLVTYPRTDSSYLPEDYVDEAKKILKSLSENEHWNSFSDKALDGVDKAKKRVFNDANVSDHFAIIPTITIPNIKDLDKDEQNIYTMIANRFKAVFMPPLVTDVTTRFSFITDTDAFRTTGTVIIDKGWTVIDEVDSKDTVLPQVKDASDIESQSFTSTEKATNPPKLYKEPDLLIAMKNAGNDLDDELSAVMDGKGIGTPATRSAIIEELLATVTSKGQPKQAMLVREKNGVILPTEYGTKILETLISEDIYELTSPQFTGEWEYKFEKIRKNELNAEVFMGETEKTVISIIEKLKALHNKYPPLSFNASCRLCSAEMEVTRFAVKCTSCNFSVDRRKGGVDFKLSELEHLIKVGESLDYYEFTNKEKVKFMAKLKFDDENKLVLLFMPSEKRKEPCPLCSSTLEDRPKTVKCTNEECGLVIFKIVFDKKLSEKNIKQLLTNRETETITGFYSKKNDRKFDGILIIDPETKKLALKPFNKEGTETEYSCRKSGCDGKYYEKSKVYECGVKCGSVIFKEIHSVILPPTKMKKLLEGGTVAITGKRKISENGEEKIVSQAMELTINTETGKTNSKFINPTKK